MEGTLLGPYRLLRVLGRGATSEVWLATVEASTGELTRGDPVAIKVLHEHLFSNPGQFRRFLKEGEHGKQIRHENLVRVYDADAVSVEGRTHHFLVMEYVEGQTLRDLIAEVGGGVAEDLARHVGREVAKALAAVHAAGVVHRDVKPENVLITRDETVKLMDLGLARAGDGTGTVTEAGHFSGSVAYAAPEQFRRGGRELDGRTDLYALGLVLYELVTGEHPFPCESMLEHVSRTLNDPPPRPSRGDGDLSPFFEEVLLALLAKDPAERFRSATKLLEVLAAGEDSEWWAKRRRRDAEARPPARLRVGREAPLCGRDAERDRLRSLFAEVREDGGRVALVTGEAGIGKSRLVDEVVSDLAAAGEDFAFLFGSWAPGGAATPASAASAAVVDRFGSAGLPDALDARLGSLRRLAPAFAALLRGEPPPAGEALTKDSIQALFVALFRSLAAERPLVLLLEDLHFAPGEGRALFAALAHAVPGHRILLVGTARPDLPAEWLSGIERLGHVRRVELGRLLPEEVERLLAGATGSGDLAAELAPRVATSSDGNPFFVVEILAGLKERGPLVRKPDGTFAREGRISEIRIPDSVRDIVRARVADLPEPERELVDVAACGGFEFDPLLVADALGRGRIPVLKDLTRLERVRGLVRSSGRSFVFDHHQLRDVVHESLSVPLREEYHALLAETLERRRSADPDGTSRGATAVELCRHWLFAGRPRRARPHLGEAMDRLEETFAPEEAASLAARLLATRELVTGRERTELLLRTSKLLNLLGEWSEEAGVLEEAVRLAGAAADDALVACTRRLLGRNLVLRANYDRATEEFEAALAKARAAGDRREEASCIGALGVVSNRRGFYEEARARFTESLRIAREEGDRTEEASAAGNLALVDWNLGALAAARAGFERALHLFGEAGNRRGVAQSMGNLAALHYELGAYEEARRCWERQLRTAREIGFRRGESIAVGGLGTVHRALGRYSEAEAAFLRERELCRELDDRRGLAVTGGHLAVVLHHTGRLAEAREEWEAALEVLREIRDRSWVAWGVLWLGQIAEAEGDRPAARTQGEDALDRFRAAGVATGEADSLLLLGRLHLEDGERERAAGVFRDALALGEQTGAPGPKARAGAGLAAAGGGDAAEVARHLDAEEARIDAYECMEARFLLWLAGGGEPHLAAARSRLDGFVRSSPAVARHLWDGVRLYRQVRAGRLSL